MKNTIIAIALFLGAVNGSAQTTILIPASADNTIYQSPSGSSNAIGENLFSGTNGGGSTRRCLIKFDIAAAIPAGALITQATLTLNCNTSRSIADDISLHKLLSNWGEGTSNAGAAGDGSGIAATTNDATWLANFFNISLWTLPGGDFTA
ncbi:MAG: DNRLRE domain-containing protein, partial [Chitinophagaceae bacterium]